MVRFVWNSLQQKPEPIQSKFSFYDMIAFWFRRDLRLEDNTGLAAALRSGETVLPVFIFDTNILDALHNRTDKRVQLIHSQLIKMQTQLKELGSGLIVRVGTPEAVWQTLCSEFPVSAIYTNEDYEPYAINRDRKIAEQTKQVGIAFHSFKDQVIFAKSEICKEDGKPYTVFTPYKKRWLSHFQPALLEKQNGNLEQFHPLPPQSIPSLAQIGFQAVPFDPPQFNLSETLIQQYGEKRDFPFLPATSRISVHLRFGMISIREVFRQTMQLSDQYWTELIWREFYMMILWHFPAVTQSFKPEYDQIPWRNAKYDFETWKAGLTGYPLVDAGMRELSATGFMHNRVRMVTASFLTKHLLMDWRLGEAWFAETLLDFDLAANNGGWQWAASSGCDAAPYFRIFNPSEQQKKFDPDFLYIRRWVPEFGTTAYPKPMVDHKVARARTLDTFQNVLKSNTKQLKDLFSTEG